MATNKSIAKKRLGSVSPPFGLLHAAIVCHDDHTYLPATIQALRDICVTVFVSELAWGAGIPGDWQETVRLAEHAGATVITGHWADETSHREASLDWARNHGIPFLLIPDSDEIISKQLFLALEKVAGVDLADIVYCSMDTYWKSPEYVIRPRERLMPPIMIKPSSVRHECIREYRGTRPLMLSEEHGVMHHLSYAGPESRIARKTSTWSHKEEIVPNWKRDIWERWDKHRSMQNLHPTHPQAYGFAERVTVSAAVIVAWDAYIAACGGTDPLHPVLTESVKSKELPKISVIIPLYGGAEDIRLCLESLERSLSDLHEVIVVDDASPDDAARVAQSYSFIKIVSNTENQGFARTCNHGAEVSTGDVLLFLNSDTIVPVGSIRLMGESLMKSGTIAAVGPSSNAVGHFQQIPVTYRDIQGVNLFAEDHVLSDSPDGDCDMLVGFCLAVRRSAWEEVGPFDDRFEVGLFEDNDLCYRLRREGYRLVYCRKAFVHHKGNASLDRIPDDKYKLFADNQARYFAKWKRDLEFGFASHLAGTSAERVQFTENRRPEKVLQQLEPLVGEANVSLCMIVKNEERVLGECLESAKPFFTQIIVVDTGSTDRTIEIAKSHGAEVHTIAWPDSFAAARNESLKHATGDWICWLDADDTLPFASGETMLKAVVNAPPEIGGLVMTVRFVTDDPEFGTTVDHVKVFRNRPGLAFEGRIHEQILPSLRSLDLDVARIPAEVLHSGYDTSEDGQARKRERDSVLLKLDLDDRPDHPFVLFNLGMTAHYNGEHHDAIQWLQRSVAVAKNGESHIRKAYALWAVSVRELGDNSEALKIVDLGLNAVPDDPEMLFHRGILLSNLERFEESAQSYERLFKVGKGNHFSSADSGIFGFKAFHNLAGVYLRLNEYGKAKGAFLSAIQSNPRYLHSAFDLFRVSLDHKDWGTAQSCIEHVRSQEGDSPNVAKMSEELGRHQG